MWMERLVLTAEQYAQTLDERLEDSNLHRMSGLFTTVYRQLKDILTDTQLCALFDTIYGQYFNI